MKCPFRKIISTTKEIKEYGLVDEATTEVLRNVSNMIVWPIGQENALIAD